MDLGKTLPLSPHNACVCVRASVFAFLFLVLVLVFSFLLGSEREIGRPDNGLFLYSVRAYLRTYMGIYTHDILFNLLPYGIC